MTVFERSKNRNKKGRSFLITSEKCSSQRAVSHTSST